MALFKFRKGGDASPPTPAQPETIEALRRRARHRLIGAAVLVLLGIIGFPLLFDTQPRPVAVDIPIEIPDRNKAKPLAPPPVAQAPVAPVAASAPSAPAAQPKASEPASAPAAPPVAKVEPPKPEPAKAEAPKPKVEPAQQQAKAEPADSKPAAPDADRAKALLEGKTVQAGAADAIEGRYVVQVGAFADAAKARETRQKVEKTGLKTYTHVAETKDGKRIRVRVGPFDSRTEADKAAARIKELQLPAAVLTL